MASRDTCPGGFFYVSNNKKADTEGSQYRLLYAKNIQSANV